MEVVAAVSPLIDVKQSARGYSIRQDQIEVMPRGADYTSIIRVIPGANDEPKLGGLSIDGASAAENRYIIDGIDTSHLHVWVARSAAEYRHTWTNSR